MSFLQIVRQQTIKTKDIEFTLFILEIDAANRHFARLRARRWARTEFPFSRPANVTILGADTEGPAQTRISEFIPSTFRRNEFRVQVGIRG